LTGDVIKLILRRYLIAGLLVWLPIIATVLVVRFILDLMDQLLPRPLRPEVMLGVHIPGLGALLALLLLVATGLLVTNIIGRSLVRAWEDFMNRIPFIRAVYGGVKSFSTTILSNTGNSFKKVLLIEYPRAGLWSVGFQTASDLRLSSAQGDEPHVCVFIPTTPNPTSGFIVLVPRSQAIELDISIDAAMKMIVTLGVVVPTPTGSMRALKADGAPDQTPAPAP
jgi:uncharacterized membrane protein